MSRACDTWANQGPGEREEEYVMTEWMNNSAGDVMIENPTDARAKAGTGSKLSTNQ
jgi:hypothetical protein